MFPNISKLWKECSTKCGLNLFNRPQIHLHHISYTNVFIHQRHRQRRLTKDIYTLNIHTALIHAGFHSVHRCDIYIYISCRCVYKIRLQMMMAQKSHPRFRNASFLVRRRSYFSARVQHKTNCTRFTVINASVPITTNPKCVWILPAANKKHRQKAIAFARRSACRVVRCTVFGPEKCGN